MTVNNVDKKIWEKLFTPFKYTIYIFLIYNGYLFFIDDWAASSQTFSHGVNFANAIEAFTASIDTFNWIILLLMFELETWVLSDEVLEKKPLKWSLMAIRIICYSLIIYAFYGYIAKLLLFYGVISFNAENICNLVDGKLAMVVTMDEYVILTAENCMRLHGLELFKINGQNLIADSASLLTSQRRAWIDVVNSGAWLGVVVILEVDVWFQIKGLLKGTLLRVSTIIKVILYSALIICAFYWGILGVILDTWDALLWILAFVFIELNLFKWQQEILEAASSGQPTS